MNFEKTIPVCIFVCFLLASCATISPPTQQDERNADYGSFPDSYQETVQGFMQNVLIDPYSAHYTHWRGPSKGWAGNGFDGYHFGYRVCVEINAKNKMGGYVGSKPFIFVINNDRVVYHEGGYSWGTVGAENVVKMCSF